MIDADVDFILFQGRSYINLQKVAIVVGISIQGGFSKKTEFRNDDMWNLQNSRRI
jgi:hypothetical protein